jgi:hypothetical protein
VTIVLSTDFWVDFEFVWMEKFPPSLMDEIGRQKVEIYKSLKPDRNDPDLLTGSKIITLGGRRYDVLFASDRKQNDEENDTRPLRVINIDVLK